MSRSSLISVAIRSFTRVDASKYVTDKEKERKN